MAKQNPDTPTSENRPTTQPSGKVWDNSRSIGAAGRGSKGRGKGRSGR